MFKKGAQKSDGPGLLGLNDNELWLSKDDGDTTSERSSFRKKKLQHFSEDSCGCV